MIELLISLALVVAAAYFMMNRKVAGSHADSESTVIENAQKRVDCTTGESTACRVESAAPVIPPLSQQR